MLRLLHIFKTTLFLVLFLFSFTIVSGQDSNVLTLKECIEFALENNSNLKMTQYSYDISRKDELGSFQGILPTVSASTGTGRIEVGPSEYLSNEPVGIDPETGNVIYEQRTRKIQKQFRESSNASLTASQTLFDGGIWWNNIRKAKMDKQSAEYNLQQQTNNIILQVQQAYFDLNKQIKLLEVNELAVNRSMDQQDRIEKMYELGARALLDVYQARVTLGNDRINMISQQNIVEQAKKYLNMVMGRDPFAPISTVSEITLASELDDLDALINEAMENQPNLRKIEADIRSSELSVSMAKGMNFPRLSAYVNYDRFHEDIIKVFSDFDKNYQTRYGISLSFNIFNGFSDYVNVQKAEINRRYLMESQEDYKRSLVSEIHQHYTDYKSYQDIIQINKQNLEAAQEELRLAQERYQIGAGTFLEIREAQVNLTRAEQTLIAAQFNARIVLAQLDFSLGLTYKNYLNKL